MRLLLFISMFCLYITNSFAQQAVPVSGGSLNGSGGNVVFTVGQMNYGSITDKNNVSVVKGIQQPVETDQKTNVDPSFNMAIKCSVSPNPTSDFIFLKIDDTKFKEYSFELIDLNGKTLIKLISNSILLKYHQIIENQAKCGQKRRLGIELKNIFRLRFLVRGLVYILLTAAGIYYPGIPYLITVSILLLFLYYKTADDEERVWIWIAISIPALYYSGTAIATGKPANFLSPVLFVFVLLVPVFSPIAGWRHRARAAAEEPAPTRRWPTETGRGRRGPRGSRNSG